jgi:high affinity Mn2+ porin
MKRDRSRRAAFASLWLLSLACPARAADLPVKAPALQAVYDWTGFYVGGHFGYGQGSLGPNSLALPLQGLVFPHSPTGLIGGYDMGYNREIANHIVFGIAADATFTTYVDQAAIAQSQDPYNSTIDYIGTVRGRIGYAAGRWMPYVTGGFAWGHTHVEVNDGSSSVIGHYAPGWVAGAGVEWAVSGNWTAKLEYDYVDLQRTVFDLRGYALPVVNIDPRMSLFQFGLNYQFGDTPLNPQAQTALPESKDWNVHAQTTVIGQGYASFRSPYAGQNSLPGTGQFQNTWTTTAFLGARLWEGGEVYFDPELAQGFGINGTLGIAGFPNGEAQKAGAPFPKIRPQRYYFKQTWGLGGEQEDVADGPNQLEGKRDIDRVTLVVGRFAVGDFFDNNAYAHDPRADFMNWAMWESAAYDFPADLPGYTRGAVIDFNRKDWAVRAGVFEVPQAPNSDVLTYKTVGTVVEFEGRYSIFEQPGKIRLAAFQNQGNTGNYDQALALEAANPAEDINTIMAGIRHTNLKYGVYANLEQQVTKDVGVFARASWNNGQTEILSFTDIDRSLTGGVSIKGSYWGRGDDTIGIGGAINGLSQANRDYLAAGGLGLLIGDGRLNYRPEQILETYYALAIDKHFTFTADYQLITNPAYNADRGPVSIFSGRLHGEF